MLEGALSGDTAVGFYKVGVWKGLCWRESIRRIQQQEAIELGGYKNRGLERSVLEGELPEDTAAGSYRSRRIKVGVWKGLCWRGRCGRSRGV